MGYRFPQPDNEDDFEKTCLRFYRKLWKNESLTLYGKRGEGQDGIDIFDPANLKPVRVIQCKHHEPTKSLEPAAIKAEVAKAEKSVLRFETYQIATTAKKTRRAQDAVDKLNRRSKRNKRFTVEIHFWEDICELLSGMPRIQSEEIIAGRDGALDFLASILVDPNVRGLAIRALKVAGQEPSAEDFAEIEHLLGERKLEVAQHKLDQLTKPDRLRSLVASEQYKLLRLQGKLALERGSFESASRFFLDAFELQPDLDQAKQNRVLAYELLSDSERAFGLAVSYTAAGLTTPFLLCRLIENAKALSDLHEYAALFDAHLDTSVDINVSLSRAFLNEGDFKKAIESATRALQIDPCSPYAAFAAGMCHHFASTTGVWLERMPHLLSALEHYDQAVGECRRHKHRLLLPEVLINRAAIHARLGDDSAAVADYREAVRVGCAPAVYAARAVSFMLYRCDFTSAWELLEFLADDIEGTFLRVAAEFHLSEDVDDRRRCLKQMRALAETDWPRAVECRMFCVDWAMRLKDISYATECVTEQFQLMFPFEAYTALAWIEVESCDDAHAIGYAMKAIEQGIPEGHPQECQILARILTRTGHDAEALDVLERIVIPGLLNEDMKQLIDCAQRLGRHDLLLRLCREMRLSEQQDDQLRRLELRLLGRYAPDQGLEIVDDFIRASTSPAFFIAYKNYLAARMGRNDLLALEPSRLPSPSELMPEDSPLVVQPFTVMGMYGEALRFLYGQLRCFFESELAHAWYVQFVVEYGDKVFAVNPPLEVNSQCAVSIEVDGATHRTIVIENDRPVASRGEFPETSDLVRGLLGRKAGDSLELPGSRVTPEKARIEAIQSKYLWAFQDCLRRFRERFPETSFVQQIVGGGDPDAVDFSPLIASLKQRKAYVQSRLDFYQTGPCTIHLMASQIGVNEYEAMQALASWPAANIKCCHVTPGDFRRDAVKAALCESVVLDVSAIVTLTLTDAWQCLSRDTRWIVSTATKELVGDWLSDAVAAKPGEGGHAWLTDHGDLRFQETTEEHCAARRAECETMKQMLEDLCECRSSPSLASFASDKRECYERFVGFHNLEAMSLARDANAMLWSDDFLLACVAQADFGVPRVWTQLILRGWADAGSVTEEKFQSVTAKLASWGYVATIWNATTIMQAGVLANWDPQDWPLRQCIDLLAGTKLSMPKKAQVALESLKLLRRTACVDIRQTAVIQSILTALGSRQAVEWMRGRLKGEFAVDPDSASFLEPEFAYWLRTHLS